MKSAGLGQIVVSRDLDDTLIAYGLGSCVGIIGFDAAVSVGGLLHALLPQRREGDPNEAKYVDSGLPSLLRQMEALGAKRRSIVWYVVGGAEMLKVPGLTGEFNIGARNAEAARQTMERMSFSPRAVDVGGSAGRTIKLVMRDGSVVVRTLGKGERAL
ncbi:MAG: chemotaxis protein CheD [Anaerolineae bacterium]